MSKRKFKEPETRPFYFVEYQDQFIPAYMVSDGKVTRGRIIREKDYQRLLRAAKRGKKAGQT